MASIEHISGNGRNCYRLRFSIDGKRQRMGLGEFDESKAIEAKEHVDHLIGQHKRNRPPHAKVAEWLDTLPVEIHDRLSDLDLCDRRQRSELPQSVLGYMRAYIDSRTDWKKSCNHKQSVNHFERFLKKDLPLVALTKGDCQRFQRWMMDSKCGPGLSANTSGQHIKRCRQMMIQAMDDGFVDANPFNGIKIDLRSDVSKNRILTEEESLAILGACPNQQWRTIFVLCRWAGLRCPSEVTRLEWSHIHWDRGRMTITSPKTERYGKGTRVVPIWPQVLTELNSAREAASAGDRLVVGAEHTSESNLRTTFAKIVERAGVTEFAKPFMALRRTRRTELERSGRYANHVLNDWFGHDGKTAAEFYLDVTEDDFAQAILPTANPLGTAGQDPCLLT